MISASQAAFLLVQIGILVITYYFSYGMRHQIAQLESAVQSLRGKQSNAQQAARRAARKEVKEAMQDPEMQPDEGGGSSMDEMLPMMMMSMMGGQGQAPQAPQDGEPETGQSPSVLGSGGSPSDQSS